LSPWVQEDAGELLLRSAGMLLEVLEYEHVVPVLRGLPAGVLGGLLEELDVVVELFVQRIARLGDLVHVVDVFSGLVEAYGDE